eukprot:m.249285 g.249285  ORF g.249285 m.249285 type:complete len:136 (+) comp16060_c0_seq1:96-503(+)
MYTLYVVNKAGSLLYHSDFNRADARGMGANERIMLASMFHSLSAIAGKLSPGADRSGIHVLEADTFRLQSYRAPTGVMFVAVGAPGQTNLDVFLRKVYELYADYVLKNPFYSLDMPIRCELFDLHLNELLQGSAF